MLTIIEGPDGAGKTTLVEDLRFRWVNTVGHHQGPYRHDVIGETLGEMSRALSLVGHVVCDRLHLASGSTAQCSEKQTCSAISARRFWSSPFCG